MWIAALCHTEKAKQCAALRVVVSSTVEVMLGCSPTEALQVEVVDKLVAKFRM
jgi:hypothetical protein